MPDPFTTQLNLANAGIAQAQAAVTQMGVLYAAGSQPPANLPQPPADVSYNPATSIYAAPTGKDTNTGSATSPVQTLSKALSLATSYQTANPGKLVGIRLGASGTYVGPGNTNSTNLLIDGSWQAVNIEQRATISGVPGGSAFYWLNAQNIHVQNCRIIPDKSGGTIGIGASAGNNLTFDYCEVDGWQTFGIQVVGAFTGFRAYGNWIANTYDPNPNTESCSGIYTEAVAPDVQNNAFFRNGWQSPWTGTNTPLETAMRFRHAYYNNPGSGTSTPGTDKFNRYLLNASTGPQLRSGGSCLYPVLMSNGTATNALVTPGLGKAPIPGEIGFYLVFGNDANDFIYWGGGVTGLSGNDNIHDGYYFDGSTTEVAAAVVLDWDSGTYGPLPANNSARVTNLFGICPNPTIQENNGRNAPVATNVKLRKANAGEKVASLLDYTGAANDAALGELLRTGLHNPVYQQPAIWAWSINQAAKIIIP